MIYSTRLKGFKGFVERFRVGVWASGSRQIAEDTEDTESTVCSVIFLKLDHAKKFTACICTYSLLYWTYCTYYSTEFGATKLQKRFGFLTFCLLFCPVLFIQSLSISATVLHHLGPSCCMHHSEPLSYSPLFIFNLQILKFRLKNEVLLLRIGRPSRLFYEPYGSCIECNHHKFECA